MIAKHTPVEPQTLKLHTATSQALEKVLTLSKGVAGWGTTSAVALATVWTNLHESASGAVCLKIDPQSEHGAGLEAGRSGSEINVSSSLDSVVLEGALKSAFTALTSQSPGDVRLKVCETFHPVFILHVPILHYSTLRKSLIGSLMPRCRRMPDSYKFN